MVERTLQKQNVIGKLLRFKVSRTRDYSKHLTFEVSIDNYSY